MGVPGCFIRLGWIDCSSPAFWLLIATLYVKKTKKNDGRQCSFFQDLSFGSGDDEFDEEIG